MKSLKERYLKVLKSNQRSLGGFRYTVPSSRVYPHQWLWDSCFHAVIYTHFDIEYAKDEIRSLLSGQWDNGMLPHMIYWTRAGKHNRDWGVRKNTSSSITQPPLIAYAVERIFREDGDADFVEEVLGKMHRYYRWLHRTRSSKGLLSIIHPWESGEDDFVEWDNVYDLENPAKEELMKVKLSLLSDYVGTGLDAGRFLKTGRFNVKPLSFNSIYLRSLKSMLLLCSAVKSGRRAYYEKLIPGVTMSFKQNMYDKETGLFHSLYDKVRFPEAMNSSIFLPLFSGVPTRKHVMALVEKYLLNGDMFWLKYPVPTVSADSGAFEPGRYWRGSTWININWLIIRGLENYGFGDVANELKERCIRLVRKSGFCEYFNSITGRGSGPRDFSWSGLVFDI